MEIRRTANAGVLLKLDGVSILLDGVCREVEPYLGTLPEDRARLSACWPDIVAFTHGHKDHFDPTFAAEFQKQTGRVILGPEDLPGVRASMQSVRVRDVTIMPIPSRHIGAKGKPVSHASFIVQGSSCVWFLGDASPLQWKARGELPSPDVLLVPYAYASTPAGWAITKSMNTRTVVLLHLPCREEDNLGLWDAVETTAGQGSGLHIPAVGQSLYLP